jgi:hypothetical protein
MREGSSIAATKASAVSWPTPGMAISRRQAAEALVIRLMSASIAATAVITAVRAAIIARMATERPAIPSLALGALSMKATVSAGQSDPEHDRQASNLVFQGHSLHDQLLARDDQAERMSLQRLHVHGRESAYGLVSLAIVRVAAERGRSLAIRAPLRARSGEFAYRTAAEIANKNPPAPLVTGRGRGRVHRPDRASLSKPQRSYLLWFRRRAPRSESR